MGRPPTARRKLDELGVEALVERIADGESLSAIARGVGVGIARLFEWIAADSERSARVRAARIASAESFADKARELLEAAADPFELAKARELGHHLRWLAKTSDPRGFGDKIGVGGAEGMPAVQVESLIFLPQKDPLPPALSNTPREPSAAPRRDATQRPAPTPAPTLPTPPRAAPEATPRAVGNVRPSSRFLDGADPRR